MSTPLEIPQLISKTDMATRLDGLLATRSFGRSIRWYDEVASTNTHAAEWASGDAPDGSVVCAESQTAGRGRFDRTWTSHRGENLTFSLILFPGLSADRLGMISVAFSVSIATVIQNLVGSSLVEIKWPNDILFEGRKICGMLQESSFPSLGGQKRVVAGIGLNVNQTDFPLEIAPLASSLKLATGVDHLRVELLATLLAAMEDSYYALHTGRTTVLRARYEAKLNSLGREVRYSRQNENEKASGVVMGIDGYGRLVVSTPTGRETVLAGDVSFRTE